MKFTTIMFVWGLTVVSTLLGAAWLIAPVSTPHLLAAVAAPLTYVFEDRGILHEAGSMERSASTRWWLNSGGAIVSADGIDATMQGDAPLLSRWRIAYALSNPLDTDGGRHPQNIFRLVARSARGDVVQSARFFIVADNLSRSPNRNQSNGLFLMSRYESGQTLYYAGVRVDGHAVIKKKYRGVYHTLAEQTVFPGSYATEPTAGTSQNLLPHGTWLSLRSETRTNPDGSVTIALFMRTAGGSVWTKVLEATDVGGPEVDRTPPIIGSGYTGIRTDFMDVRFADYRTEPLR